MISALFLVNVKGEIVISRIYRDDVIVSAANTFRTRIIAAKEADTATPVRLIEGCTFVYVRYRDLFYVAISRSNANAAMVLQFLTGFVDILKGYFGQHIDEDTIRGNFTLVYELLDEVLDFGYPQTTAIDVLKLYINLGQVRAPQSVAETAKMTSAITGARDWRQDGIVYRKNQMWVDVHESVNLLLSSSNAVLQCNVTGVVKMKSELSGMPECKLALNDKLLSGGAAAAAAAGGGGSGPARRGGGVELEDVSFHRCVQLSKFDADRTITFVPPDGEFELMRYRITENIKQPFRVIPVVEEAGPRRVMMNVKAVANYPDNVFANNVVFKIPTPPNTTRCHITTRLGSAKYRPEERAIVWRVRRFPGAMEAVFQAEVELIPSIKKKQWVRPPISVDFQVSMFPASGIQVRNLKVWERSRYDTQRWVRYLTRAGSYQVRI